MGVDITYNDAECVILATDDESVTQNELGKMTRRITGVLTALVRADWNARNVGHL